LTQDPYCWLDPTCASPFSDDDSASTAPGRGFAVMSDPLLVNRPATMLATPNYLLFLSLYSLCLAGSVRLRTQGIRAAAIAACATFATLEVGRWAIALLHFSELSNDFLPLDPWTWPILFVTVLPLVLVTRRAWSLSVREVNSSA